MTKNLDKIKKKINIFVNNDPEWGGTYQYTSLIIKAIESKFDVKVTKVATIRQIGKNKQMTVRSGGRTIRTAGKRSDFKKAIITLDSDSTIDIMRGDVSS